MQTSSFQVSEQRRTQSYPSMPGIVRLSHAIVNSYLVRQQDSPSWVLVETGLPGSMDRILRAARKQFGQNAKPLAIILTHGHFDHVGTVDRLARRWDVPVYAHPLELPYLTGRSPYPPPDPTVGGGLVARLAGLFPSQPINLADRIQALPPDGRLPMLPGWRWIHTPGHSPGHVSLFRDGDRVLIAGDAFVTLRQESIVSLLSRGQALHGPPKYFTPDWLAAHRSLQMLAGLEPEVAATGHGSPMSGARLRDGLRTLARDFLRRAVPAHGRYVRQPALMDEHGLLALPPRVADPMPKVLGVAAAVLTVAAVWGLLHRSRSRNSMRESI